VSLLLDALKKAAYAKCRQEEDQHTGQRPPTSHAEAAAGVAEGNVDSQRVAHAVFDSKRPFAGERVRRTLFVFAAAVAVLGVLALGGYTYHQQRDDRLRAQFADFHSARQQAVEPRNRTPPERPEPAPTPQTDVVTAPRASPESAAAPGVEPASQPSLAGTPPQPEEFPTPSAEAVPAEAVPEEHDAVAAPAPQVSEVNIVRNQTRAQVAAALAAGYESFQRGAVDEAQIYYARALQMDEHNRDALLGLAAIAVKQGGNQRALQMYRELLRKNPRDSVAAAALSSLPGAGSARTRESELKVLLHNDPHAAELHFALGTLYGGERRWAEAQTAFFEAHQRDDSNPDYLFNLAVSLDHMNKTALARNYYDEALTAAKGRAASFDPGAVRDRVRELRGARGGNG